MRWLLWLVVGVIVYVVLFRAPVKDPLFTITTLEGAEVYRTSRAELPTAVRDLVFTYNAP